MITSTKILGCDEKKIVIESRPDVLKEIQKKHIANVEIRLDDGRCITAEQRKKAYAIMGEIAHWSGHFPEEVKEYAKFYFLSVYGQMEYFSLSNCSMTTAREFINYLTNFCLENDVPSKDSLLTLTDDIDRYLYQCLYHKKCCICGKDADFHHCEKSRIGMGRNRREVPNIGVEGMALCRKHHEECHRIGEETFCKKYIVYGIRLDNELCEALKIEG